MLGFYVPYSSRSNKAPFHSGIILLAAQYTHLLLHYFMMPAAPKCWSARQEKSKNMTSIGYCRLFFSAPRMLVLTMTSAAHGVCVWSKE